MLSARALDVNRLTQSFVAFIDLLGFGDRVRTAKSPGEIRRLYASLDAIRHQFEFRPQEASTREAQKAVAKRVLMFSDCVVISIPARSAFTKLTGAFDLFASELHNLALSQGVCALQGHFVRGAVDFGLWYYRNDFLISPALARAYQLEASVEPPVIAVTPELHGFLANNPDRKRYSSDIDPMGYLFRTDAAASGKPVHYLDYIRMSLETMVEQAARKGRAEMAQRVRRWLSDHAKSIRAAHANAPDGRPKVKFQWLAKYHNAAVRQHANGAQDVLVKL
jgi:hypothetical protein